MNQVDFWFHRFRATYATHCLRNGMDIASLRDQMGHADLKSIERYLRALDQDKRAEKVTLVWAKAAVKTRPHSVDAVARRRVNNSRPPA